MTLPICAFAQQNGAGGPTPEQQENDAQTFLDTLPDTKVCPASIDPKDDAHAIAAAGWQTRGSAAGSNMVLQGIGLVPVQPKGAIGVECRYGGFDMMSPVRCDDPKDMKTRGRVTKCSE